MNDFVTGKGDVIIAGDLAKEGMSDHNCLIVAKKNENGDIEVLDCKEFSTHNMTEVNRKLTIENMIDSLAQKYGVFHEE